MSAHLCSGKDFLQTFRVFLAILLWKAHKSITVWGVTLPCSEMLCRDHPVATDWIYFRNNLGVQAKVVHAICRVTSWAVSQNSLLLFWRISVPWWWCCLMVQHSLSHSFKEKCGLLPVYLNAVLILQSLFFKCQLFKFCSWLTDAYIDADIYLLQSMVNRSGYVVLGTVQIWLSPHLSPFTSPIICIFLFSLKCNAFHVWIVFHLYFCQD